MTAAPIRILAIDDEQLLLWALDRACKDKPLDITTASSHEEALAKLGECHYDLFLLDFDLRDKQRVDLLQEIDARCPFIPIIFMTTSNMNSVELNNVIRDTRKHGSWHLLEKPFKLDRMIGFIELIFKEQENVKICLHDLTHNYDNEKRVRSRYPHVQSIKLSYKSIIDGQQEETETTGILTDVSDTGVGLLTRTPLRPEQVINFGEDMDKKCGVVAWSNMIESETYRAGIILC